MSPRPSKNPAKARFLRAFLFAPALIHPVSAELIHRWSLDEPAGDVVSGTPLTDTVSGAIATVVGAYQTPARFTGTSLRLPGTSNGNHSLGFLSAYIDLPNGIISSHANLSVEIWATPHSVTGYDRLFDFGRTNLTHGPSAEPGELVPINGQGQTPGSTNSDDSIYYSFSIGDDANGQRLDAVINDDDSNPNLYYDASQVTTLGTEYYYVLTFEDGVGTYGASGGRVTWYRDATVVHTADVAFRLQDLEDVNNWLGRSQWTDDWNADASYDEIRIYDHVLSTAEISGHLTAGPDSLVDPDTDDDGLVDLFEDQYFGNHDGTASESELALYSGEDDPDNDGFSNLQEQQIGTDPTDPTSPPPAPTPDHLWTFTHQANSAAESGISFTDEMGSSWEITLRGNGGQLDGRQVILPGSTTGNQPESAISAYLDLSNGVVSASPSVTFEAWATPVSSKTWQRLFDFGRCVQSHGTGAAEGEILDDNAAPGLTGAWDNLSLTFNNNNDFNTQQLEGEYDDLGPVYTTSTATTLAGQEYHYALVVEDGVGELGSSGCRVTWYRDGVLQNSDDFAFRLVDMEDVNNWIGRSMYTGDSNSNLALNELRIYRRALSQQEIQSSLLIGPDPSSGPEEPPTPAPVPVRRWNFNTAAGNAPEGTLFLDEATGEPAVVHGQGGLLTGSELLIGDDGSGNRDTTNGTQTASNISSYLELPNGFLQSFTNLTLEAWITPRSSGTWQRVWDFGNCSVTSGPGAEEGEIVDTTTAPAGFNANDNLFLSLNNNGTLGSHRLGGKLDGGTETQSDTDLSSITNTGEEYHFIMTVTDGAGTYASSGCQVKWFRDGVLYGSIDLAFHLQDMEDVNNWIGRSNWSADQNSHLSINELRVYDRAVSLAEIKASLEAGADTSYDPPVALDDSSTLHPGQKVRIPVTANDSGSPDSTTLTILTAPAHGTAEVHADGTILYTHDGSEFPSDVLTYTVANLGGTSNVATVHISLTTSLRIANPEWSMPSSPPSTAWDLVDALPGLTFNEPLCLTSLPGDARQLYVCERMAKIQRVDDVSSLSPAKNLFLDLQQVVANAPIGTEPETIEGGGNAEHGLLGLAFHPNYANNRTFFVAYTIRKNGGSYYQRIARFEADPDDPTVADPNSQVVLIEQLDEGANHNGGDLHFGPDGYLYYAAGDEENAPRGQLNSQKIDGDFFSGIFRLDVDLEAEDNTEADGTGSDDDSLPPNAHDAVILHNGHAAYEVPIDNPFVSTNLGGDWDGTYNGSPVTGTVRTEFWATGLRHVWRMSFDSATGDLWAGDVGQVTYEEIDKIERGVNYGWAYREGAHDFNGSLGTAPTDWTSTDPIYEYVHTAIEGGDANFKGNSVCGGSVYRGSRFPDLYGTYIFCDSTSGHVWQMDTTTGSTSRIAGLAGAYGVFSSMGVDPSNQDILFCAYLTGKIMRLTSGSDLTAGFPQTLSETGLFADLSDLSPAPGMLPVEPNLRFWSDYAEKTRWFGIPDGTSQMTWQEEGPWTYPSGMVWVKHFDLALTRDDPSTHKRIETRVLVKTDDGVYGVSYRWNDDSSEAYLVEDAGAEFDLEIDDHGTPHTQHWTIPGRTSCLTCHDGRPLSFYTRQLNHTFTMAGMTGNQLDLLSAGGYFSNTPYDSTTLAFHVRPDETQYPLEQRVRSYLDVNCAYCHHQGGSVSGFWDGREQLSLEETGIINVPPVQNIGSSLNKYIVPGDALHSVILQRAAATNGFTRMPPLASAEIDPEGIALLTEWIQSGLPEDRLYDDWAQMNGVSGPRDADDDGDGRSNHDEFLLGSGPLSGVQSTPLVWESGQLRFTRQPFRIYDIETSSDLSSWLSWDASENVYSYGSEPELEEIPAPTGDTAHQYFRLRVSEP
ncbi:putative repeat protein (TIGR03806 family) [Haloferula luteola]|uniref:Putative repeat protein (TIGR03806 family) n=1 Tax=Haloferula luteola TaxID=595692 RepID=A0A840VEW1_9BACT|nr:LamG-like jellyroll fold domain-containing protein [Haloferula luteola]MBB5352369.1 putative repeat protein (TIGR03806 family) [Haloferula luteola]